MNEIDFEKFYEKFDLEFFLLNPVGRFSRKDLALIYDAKLNVRSIAVEAMVYGIREAMASTIKKVNDDEEWRDKIRHLNHEQAVEIYFRLYLIYRLKEDFKILNDETL